jgi:tetratricopeptide (TPR) repeat protein
MVNSKFCYLERGFAYAKEIPEIITCSYDNENAEGIISFKETQIFDKSPFFDKGLNELIILINEVTAEKIKKETEKINKATEKSEKELLLEIKELLDQKLIYKPIDAASGLVSTFDNKVADNQPKENSDEEKVKESLSLNIKLKIAEEKFDKAKYLVAEELFKDLTELYDENSEEKAYVLYKLGDVYNELAKYNDALEYYRNSLAIRENLFGMESTEAATVYNNMGVVYNELAKIKSAEVEKKDEKEKKDLENEVSKLYKKAMNFYEKSLIIQEKLLKEDDPEIARIYGNMGYTYTLVAEYDKAFKFTNRGLEIRQKKLGENHKDTAMSYSELGIIHFDKGEYDKALENYEISLEIRKKVLSENHPSTANSYNNIGRVYFNKDKYDKALNYYKKALEIYKKVLGKEYPNTKDTYYNITLVYRALGDTENEKKFSRLSMV